MFLKQYKYSFLISFIILLTGCFSYYKKNIQLNQAFEHRDFAQADDILNKKKWKKRNHNILLYYLNKGAVLHMLGKYKESNEYFQSADFYIEDYHKKYGWNALSYLSNPSIVPYSGENYEKILLHYYSTLNYLMLNNFEDALVECKRMLLMMDNISTYFKSEHQLHRDAFTHLLLGIVYDAQKDYNNAFIAYRNAYEVYNNDYLTLLGTQPPLQLKKDLLRTAYLSGFYSDVDMYEKEFNFKYDTTETYRSSLVCFWNNGMCPEKEKNNITFIITNMGGGFVVFTNVELGLSFPFFIGNDKNKMDGLIRMRFLRVSFPKFVTRPPMYQQATVYNDSVAYPLETAENIDAVAHQTLKDRMKKELGEALLRTALKKVTELEATQNNRNIGFAVNIANTITEQADTRNWQLLPFSINYTRVDLNKGINNISFSISNDVNQLTDSLQTITDKQKTFFYSYTTPAAL